MGEAFLHHRGNKESVIQFNNVIPVMKGDFATLQTAVHSGAPMVRGTRIGYAGGMDASNKGVIIVNIWDDTGTRKGAASLSVGRGLAGVAPIADDLDVLGGGWTGSACSAVVETINLKQGSTRTLTSLNSARHWLVAVSYWGMVSFIGGKETDNNGTGMHEYYRRDLTHGSLSSAAYYSVPAYCLAASAVGYNLFIATGGLNTNTGTYSPVVNSFDYNFTRTDWPNLDEGRMRLAAATIGTDDDIKWVLVAGGCKGGVNYSDVVDVYTKQGIKRSSIHLPVPISRLEGVSGKHFAVFTGGEVAISSVASKCNNKAYIIDQSLNITTVPMQNSKACHGLVKLTGDDGVKYVSMGGYTENWGGCQSGVEYLKIAEELIILPETKYKLGDMTSEATATNYVHYPITKPITGYMKIPNKLNLLPN